MIEVRRCTIGANKNEGVGVFLDNKIVSWMDWKMMKDRSPIRLTLVGI